METKLQTLKNAAAKEDWRTALSIAARFPRLGLHRNTILDAHMAYTNPRFLTQVGRDVETCKMQGRAALIEAYKLA